MGLFFSKQLNPSNSNCKPCQCNDLIKGSNIQESTANNSSDESIFHGPRVLGGPDIFGLPSGTYRSPSYINCLNKCKVIDDNDPSERLKIVGYRTPSFQSCIDKCTVQSKYNSEGFKNHNNKLFSLKTILLYIFMILLIYFIIANPL